MLLFTLSQGKYFFFFSFKCYIFGIDWNTLNDAQRSSAQCNCHRPNERLKFKMVKSCSSKGDGKMEENVQQRMRKKNPIKNLVMMSDLTLFHVKLTFIATRWFSKQWNLWRECIEWEKPKTVVVAQNETDEWDGISNKPIKLRFILYPYIQYSSISFLATTSSVMLTTTFFVFWFAFSVIEIA